MKSLEYFAGILDVSGSLCVTTRRERGDSLTVCILVQNDDRRLLALFADRWGGKITEVSLKSDRARFTWGKRGRHAQQVLRDVRPYIHIREREFDRLLAVEINPRGGQRFRPLPSKSIGAELMRGQR